MLLTTLLITTLTAALFWQPQMDKNYIPESVPTARQKYINEVNDAMHRASYETIKYLLANCPYSRQELPWNAWETILKERKKRANQEQSTVEGLEELIRKK